MMKNNYAKDMKVKESKLLSSPSNFKYVLKLPN